jgi:hypothetical protein
MVLMKMLVLPEVFVDLKQRNEVLDVVEVSVEVVLLYFQLEFE